MSMTAHRDVPASKLATEPRFPAHVWLTHVGAFALFASVPLLLLDSFRQEAFDLAIYDQSIWLLANGMDFNTVAGIHVFGAHLSPVLVLLRPLAAIPGGAVPEIVFEAWILALSVFPIHRLVTRLGRPSRPFLTLFALHPAVFTASWFGFHPWTLAAPLLIGGIAALTARPRWWVLAGFGSVGLVLREDIGFWMVILASILVLGGRLPWRQWLMGATVPGILSAVVVFALMPALSPVGDYLYSSSFGGETPSVNIAAFATSSVVRIVYLVLPLGFGLTALRRGDWRPALPLLVPLIGLGLRGGNALATTFHYDVHLALGVLTVVALAPGMVPRTGRVAIGSVVTALALGALRPTTPDVGPNPWGLISADRELAAVADEVRLLDDGSMGLSLPTQLVPHFSQRAQITIFPSPFDRNSREPYPMACPLPTVVVSDAAATETPVWDEIAGRYRLVADLGRYTLYRLEGPKPEGVCRPT